MNEPKEQPTWCRHPVMLGLACGVAFFLFAAVLISFVPPAWAAVSIPITDRITIDMGELLQWAQFILGAAGFWLVYSKASAAEKKASGAETASLLAVKQTDGVLEKVADLAKKEGRQEERTQVAAAKELVRSEAIVDAEHKARVAGIESSGPGATETPAADGKKPLPVIDDATRAAVNRSADALENSAESAKRTAEAAERTAKLAEDKKS